MGFERFGSVGFTSQTKVERFIEFLDQGKIARTRCKKCGKVFFPPRTDCYSCLSSDVEWSEVKGKGKLMTYTKSMYAPYGFEQDAPYILAVADFGDCKVFGRLSKEIPDGEIQIGMEVVPRVVNLPEERITYELTKA